MAASGNRQSFLTYEPISFSLTDGTSIPAPQHSPPPTSNGPAPAVQTPARINGGEATHQGRGSASPAAALRTPTAPSIASKSPRQPGVRRLFSLNSLRSSFSSSRASLALPQEDYHDAKRPHSPSASFVTAASTQNGRPQSRASKKGGSWFKRKSTLFSSNRDGTLASIGEDGRPESKRLRETSPAPLLPEIKSLAGGDLKGGHVDWDEQHFRRE